MKRAVVLIVLLSACSKTVPADAPKPDGQRVFDILFSSIELALSEEPLCDMVSASRKNAAITLGQHLATILSPSYESESVVTIKSSCMPSKHEYEDGGIVDVWDCQLEVLENSQDGDSISSSMILFSTLMDDSEIIKGSLRCM